MKRTIAAIVAFTFAFLAPGIVFGQTTPSEPPGEPVESQEAPEVGGAIEPLLKGAPAPFTGLLVPEDRYIELMEAENRARELAIKLAVQEQTAKAIEAIYLKKLDEATNPIPWYDTPTFNRWLGVLLGAAATGLAVWGGIEVTKATTR